MKTWTLFASALLLSTNVSITPAKAWLFDDDEGWPIFSFHRYGGDVNRPGSTPDRPYWHGDDAVPLGLRWQDLEAARAQAAADDAAVAAAAVVVAGPRLQAPVPHRSSHVRIRKRMARNRCVPMLPQSSKDLR